MQTENLTPLVKYLLRLGDNCLILGQRLSEWCGHGPQLEEDIALTNIALDLIGQSRSFLTLAGEVQGEGNEEDDFAFKRGLNSFFNCKIMEQPNGNYAYTIARQFFVDQFHVLLYNEMKLSNHDGLQAIALKNIKEVSYHARHSGEWVIRLGDGTPVSKEKMQAGIDHFWTYAGELFEMDVVENELVKQGIAVDTLKLKPIWIANIKAILDEATLTLPEDGWSHKGGRKGEHSEHLGFLLAEMQYLPKMYPDAKW